MEDWQKQINYRFHLSKPATIFLIIQIVFVVFLIISLSGLFQSDKITDDDPSRIPVAKISNFDSVAPENFSGDISLIEATLFDLILRNSPGTDISKSVDVLVRENSARSVYFEDQNLNYFSAIVDIPELEQSYWFYNEYSDIKPNRYIDYSKTYRIFCLDDSQEIIYPDFNCQDDFGTSGRHELVSELIEYLKFDNFIPIYSIQDNPDRIEISPYTFDELPNSTKESYIQQVKEAIASLGIPPDIFSYSVMTPGKIRYYYPIE